MSPKDFARFAQAASQFIQTDALIIAGQEATNHFKHSFDKGVEGFTDETLEKWPDISEARKKQKATKGGALKPILTDSSNLHDSIDYETDPATHSVAIGTDVPYAQRHNEGTDGMPKRQFMGQSKQLDETITDRFNDEFKKLLNPV